MIYWGLNRWRVWHTKKRLKDFTYTAFPTHYELMLKEFTPYQHLSQEELKRFQAKFLFFLDDKIFNGVGELEVTEEMKVMIAAEACLMITNLSGGVYEGLKNIYVLEDAFIPRDNPINAATGLPTHSARLGEAWKKGPIVLSWRSITQGSSVVFHEFSHHLDQQDGSFDGTPKLGKSGNYDKWAEVLGKEFLKLRETVKRHRHTVIDTYGATNEAEFFAVVTELFFTQPRKLEDNHPELFQIFKKYFKLNPKLWA